MKLQYFICTLLLLGGVQAAQAQVCTPDQSVKNKPVGFHPDSIPSGKVNVPYSATIHVKTPKDTMVTLGGFPVKANIDSVKVLKVLDMPAGFNFICDNPRCVFVYDSIGCGTFSGTPASGGTFPLRIVVRTFARVGFPITQNDTITRFVLRVEGPSNVYRLAEAQLQVFPNPASDKFTVFIPQTLPNQRLEVFTSDGRSVMSAQVNAGNNLLRTTNLKPGTYILNYGNWRNTLIVQP
jgi:hypothetical protein